MIRFFCICQILEKIDFKKDYDSVKKEVFYSILIEFKVHIELVRLIKLSLRET
jgi:hypothetical protein